MLAVGGENIGLDDCHAGGGHVGLTTVMLEVGGGHVGLMTVVSAGCAATKVTSKRFSRVAVLDSTEYRSAAASTNGGCAVSVMYRIRSAAALRRRCGVTVSSSVCFRVAAAGDA